MKNQLFSLFVVILLCFTDVALAQSECQCTAEDAIDYVGGYCEVTGIVVSTHESTRSGTVFLNIGNDFPNQEMRIVIFPNHLANFKENPLRYYTGRTIKVKGKVIIYRGDVQIIVDGEVKIEVIE